MVIVFSCGQSSQAASIVVAIGGLIKTFWSLCPLTSGHLLLFELLLLLKYQSCTSP